MDIEMKTIPGFSNYLITYDGKIWNKNKNRFLSQDISNGYAKVSLKDDNGNRSKKYVHRLVAEVFIPNYKNLPTVNHKDENPLNNNYNNLEWCSYNYNNNYGSRNERSAKSLGKPVKCIETNKIYDSIAEAARQTNIPASNICLACQHKRQIAGDYHWEYIKC